MKTFFAFATGMILMLWYLVVFKIYNPRNITMYVDKQIPYNCMLKGTTQVDQTIMCNKCFFIK